MTKNYQTVCLNWKKIEKFLEEQISDEKAQKSLIFIVNGFKNRFDNFKTSIRIEFWYCRYNR